MLSTLGSVLTLITKIVEGLNVFARFENNGAALTAIATIGPPFGDEFLTTKARSAFATFSGDHSNGNFVDKLHK
jgi:hypothetical protein